jgi:hypothetical protein
MAANRSISNHIFFENITTTGIGKDLMVVSDASQMTLKFICTGTFQAKITADISPKECTFKSWACYKNPDNIKITDVISDANPLYTIDLSGIDYLRVELVALTGTISAYGKVVG